LGHTVVIAVQDDHSRLVYAELHGAENAANVWVTLKRAAIWMREQGCGPVEAVLSDNAECYTGHRFADTLTELGAHHIRIPPYTPRWNGKLERFFGTLEDEWPTAAPGPTAPPATAHCHRSCATSTAGAHTQPPAADHPSPASSKTAGRTTSDGRP
jgi:transposase InsO family protein